MDLQHREEQKYIQNTGIKRGKQYAKRKSNIDFIGTVTCSCNGMQRAYVYKREGYDRKRKEC